MRPLKSVSFSFVSVSVSFVSDSGLCPVTYIKHYITKTQSLRSDPCLLNSCTRPHKHVTNSTVARWIRSMLQNAGIDVSLFLAHSSRTASTSYSANAQLPLADILQAGGWSKAQTFAEHYNKPLVATLMKLILTLVHKLRSFLTVCSHRHRKCNLIFVPSTRFTNYLCFSVCASYYVI